MRQSSPRIPPGSADAFTDEQKELVGDWGALNFSRVIVEHPALYRVLVPFIAKLIRGSDLPARDREILILRTLALCDEVYEAHHHVLIARNAGMTEAEVEAARAGGASLCASEQPLLRAAEELVRDHSVSDATWQVLAGRYSRIELMELVSVVGGYTLMAMLTRSLGIQLEDPDTFNTFTRLRNYT